MSDLLPFLVIGIVSGSLYGLAGMGLTLTYKTAGVFNFAHGAVGAAGAYAFFELHFTHGLPWPIALAVVVGVLGPALGLVLERIGRRLAELSPASGIVGTVGLLLVLQGFLTWRFGAETRNVPAFLPTSGFRMAGVNVSWGQVIVTVLAAGAALGLYALLQFTAIGAAMRAVVDDAPLLALTGTSPTRVRALAWMIGSSFAVLTGVLIAPSLGLDAVLLTLLVVQAFGACAIGRFSSLPWTYAGGLVIGVLAALATKYVTTPTLAGLGSSLPFFVLFVVLIVTPSRRLTARAPRARRVASVSPIPRSVSVVGGGASLVFLLAVPWLVGARLPVWTNALTFVIVFLSLSLLVQTSGQISLCHAALAALGATTFSHLSVGAGLPWLLALLGAGLAVVPLGLLVAIPAIRLSGVYLAIATFGLGIVMERVVFGTGFMFGEAGFRSAPRPDFWLFGGHGDRAFYFVVLAVTVAASAVTLAVRRSQLGRFLRALADSPTALTTNGLDVNVTRVLVFCVAAFLAGIAGALFIAASGQASGVGFTSFQSLTWLAVLAIAGTRPMASAYLAAAFLAISPAYLPDWFADYQTMLFGALAIAAALLSDGGPRVDLRAALERRALSPVRERMTVAVGTST